MDEEYDVIVLGTGLKVWHIVEYVSAVVLIEFVKGSVGGVVWYLPCAVLFLTVVLYI